MSQAIFQQGAGTDEILCVDQLADLVGIFDTDVQLCILQRPQQREIMDYLDAAENDLGNGIRQSFNRGTLFPAGLLPDMPGRKFLLDDIHFLMEIYFDLTGCDGIALRLMVLDRAMCPRFHTDLTGIRLLCTWNGPGTQWLSNDYADRSKLGEGSRGLADLKSGLIRDPRGIGEVPAFAIALLKGDAWVNNAGKGIIHRSPALVGTQKMRIALSLDALWND
ncbi:DUF1826 domain-containing protein [Acidithiobacillus montserratensis]|uniref:DUF1826 domain-containing protein n=1 Tax=Acidithiobacillus montserratensis TaxID=2729135 RepID=A0ACD5HF88_9PROT|nr:DUF1826 domain-containing protein [Acidithiobacillus montserratensis]MBN2678766.1 DUF1826 domain-containing protein [Acidithiobacillaceae bacterium]MBU2747460.1 DUF1826 domain-containing protein [Acidithiobacillus montserratensis]